MEALHLPQHDAYVRYHDLPGAAPALIYLHCLGGAAALTLRTASHPALAGRRAILVDLLGFGFSDRPQAYGYTLGDHADAVAALIDHLGLRGCNVIGHSMGGHVAVALALRWPDLVARLVLAEAPLTFGPDSASRIIATQPEATFMAEGQRAFVAGLRAEAANGDATTAAFFGAFAIASPQAIHRGATSLLRDGLTLRDRFLGLQHPRAFLWGARTLAAPEQASWAAKLAPQGIATAIVPGAGHHMNLDNPEGFALTLARLLDGDGDGRAILAPACGCV